MPCKRKHLCRIHNGWYRCDHDKEWCPDHPACDENTNIKPCSNCE